jgi:hypothetical protein
MSIRAFARWRHAQADARAAEDTIASLPASILPANESAAGLQTASVDGRKVYVLEVLNRSNACSSS